MSRTPIREALRRLDALGLVVFRPNRGVLVRAPSRDELRQSIVARAALEGAAAELAATRISAEQLERLEGADERYVELSHRLQEPGIDEAVRPDVTFDWLRVNDTFHDIVLEAAGMPLLRDGAQRAPGAADAAAAPVGGRAAAPRREPAPARALLERCGPAARGPPAS